MIGKGKEAISATNVQLASYCLLTGLHIKQVPEIFFKIIDEVVIVIRISEAHERVVFWGKIFLSLAKDNFGKCDLDDMAIFPVKHKLKDFPL